MESEQTPDFDEGHLTYTRNHETLLAMLQGGRHVRAIETIQQGISIRLERVLANRATQECVPFDGPAGLEAVLAELAKLWPSFDEQRYDGHLMGLSGELTSPDGAGVFVSVSLGAGGQVTCAVGPSSSIVRLLDALEGFDRQLHVAARALGEDYELLAEGYNPFVSSPLDVPLVPRTRWTLLNAHLSQTGRYARDMMRCACSTQVSLDYGSDRNDLGAYKLAVALSPLLTFLTDNVRSFRGSGARRCPRMVRSVIWEEVDPTRCGVVPGTFASDFSYDSYLTWLEGVQPIFFVDAMGSVSSTGKRTTREIMRDRVLSAGEGLGLFETVLPYVRLGRSTELHQADALRPRMAAGYAAFIKGLFSSALAIDSARTALGRIRDEDVDEAMRELRRRGWEASVYGRSVTQVVEDLLQIARTALDDPQEQRILNNIAEQWDVCMVPRDAFVRQQIKADRGW